MPPTVFDIRRDADAEFFRLSTTRPGRNDPRPARDYLLSRCITGRGGAAPKIIVLHIQQGRTTGSLGSWVDDRDNDGAPRAASATVTIQADGSLLRVIPEEHGPWTNGRVQRPSAVGRAIVDEFGPDPNAYTLSIEAEGQPDEELPRAQLKAIVWQVNNWMRRYDIPRERVVRHSDFDSVDRGFCPGSYFDRVAAALEPDQRFEPFPAPRVFVVPADVRATGRERASRRSRIVEEFDAGALLESDGVLRGETVEGDDRWLRLGEPRHLAVHTSGLVEAPGGFPFNAFPAVRTLAVPDDVVATARERPTRAALVAATFGPGAEVACDGAFQGEPVAGEERWLRTRDGRLAVHASGLEDPTSIAAGLFVGGLKAVGGAWAALDAHNAEIARAARKTGVPPNLLKSMINRESSGNWARDGSRTVDVGRRKSDGTPNLILPFVGVFQTTAASWGFDFQEMIGNKPLQVEVMATILAGLAARHSSFERAVVVYFGGESALTRIFCDEFGMCSDEYSRKALRDWHFLDGLGA